MQIKFDHLPDILVFYLKRFNQVIKSVLIMEMDFGIRIWIFTKDTGGFEVICIHIRIHYQFRIKL